MVSPSLYVEVDGVKVSLDNGRYENAFLSHAHSDHTRGIKRVKKLLSSKETKHLIEISKEPISLKKLEMRNAGHILGARQLVAEEDGRKSVYTGDIRLKNGILEKGAEVVECDKLIIEATYAKKIFSFPDPFEVYEQISKAVALELLRGNSIIFGAYALGKAQELIKVINEYLSIPVVVDEKVYGFSKKYVELGIDLDFVRLNSEEAKDITSESFVYITSPSGLNRKNSLSMVMEYGMPFKMFYATGWIRKFSFKKYDMVFPLSDHADFKDILYYIEQSNAKEIILFGGDGEDLLHYKRINGISIKISGQ